MSTAVVAVGEIGDKTQLLALMLAARYRKPWPILLGILIATLANHALAGSVGKLVQQAVPEDVLRWLVALAFFAVAAWALKPDALDGDPVARTGAWGVLGVTIVSFFLAEMGDKTQVATVVLAARFNSLVAVVAGSTLGLLLANLPVVIFGKMASGRIPFRAVRMVAAAMFAALGVATLMA